MKHGKNESNGVNSLASVGKTPHINDLCENAQLTAEHRRCPECGDADHLYAKADAKWDRAARAWIITELAESGAECTTCDWVGAMEETEFQDLGETAAGEGDRDLLLAILNAQTVTPYRGWNITALNEAVDAARAHLGLPSIRDLNPDIAAMQDAASKSGLGDMAASVGEG